jgi:hypothetical protein
MNTLLWNIASGVLRHVLTYGAGALVTGGYLTDSEAAQGIGAAMALVGLAWMIISKHLAETRVAVALATPVPDPIILSPSDPRDNTTDLNKAEVKRHGG